MSEREQANDKGIPDETADDPREERLRTLLTAAFPPEYPAAEPSATLRRQAAEAAARYRAQASRRTAWWSLRPMQWATVAGVALMLVVLGALFFQWSAVRGPGHPSVARQPIAPQVLPPPELDRRPAEDHPRSTGAAAALAPSSRSHPGGTSPHAPHAVGGGSKRGPKPSSLPVPRRPLLARDDLDFMNESATGRRSPWAQLTPSEWDQIEARVRRQIQLGDDFVHIPFPRLASAANPDLIATAVASYRREAAVVDARLAREVTLQFRATALSDLCDRVRADTGIHLTAGQSVADEKVTLFCAKMPLRDVMRQLARPFSYTWLRSGKEGEYRYELVQDLRSQLVEEELRNRDRNEALIALEREVARYRPYLGLTPDEALARAKTAAPAEKKLLEELARYGWGPVQMYFRLSSRQLAAVRSGQSISETWSTDPKPGEDLLPPDVARGVFQSMRDWRLYRRDDAFHLSKMATAPADAQPVGAVEGTVATVRLWLRQSELGEITLRGNSGFYTTGTHGPDISFNNSSGVLAVGRKPAPPGPAVAIDRDPALRRHMSFRPEPACPLPSAWITADTPAELLLPRVTSANALEAIHRATGLPVVADFYTRFALQRDVIAQDQPLARALDRVAEALRLRWNRDGEWLQFRSTTYYDDRHKEVPNRLLARWSAARQKQGMLTLDDLLEITQLTDAQLDGSDTAAGAILCSGLQEWHLARSRNLRSHLRYLATFTPAQRQEAISPGGLTFPRMSLGQQQQFIALGIGDTDRSLRSLDELAGAALRVDYSQPGWYKWQPPGLSWFEWVVPTGQSRRMLRPPVRERSREAALQAAQQMEATYHASMLRAAQRMHPELDEAAWQQQASQIVPTTLDLAVIYMPGTSHDRSLRVVGPSGVTSWATWETSIARRE